MQYNLFNKSKAFNLIVLYNVDLNFIRSSATYLDYNKNSPYYRSILTENDFIFLKEMVHLFYIYYGDDDV